MPCSGPHSPTNPLSEFTSFAGAFTPIPHPTYGMKRQTLEQRNSGVGNYYHIYRWTNPHWELHIHFKANGSINWFHTKLKCRRCSTLKHIPGPSSSGSESESNVAARNTVRRAIAGTAKATSVATTSVAKTMPTATTTTPTTTTTNPWSTGGNAAAKLFG